MADGLILQNPGAYRYLAIIPILILLYMVGSRYRRHIVSSTLIWRSVRRDMEAQQRLRWPPLSLLMMLQILAIGLGAFALARPALPSQEQAHLVILLDSSASMEATDVAPSRFQVATRLARQAISQMQPGDLISLVQVGPSLRLLASTVDTAEVQASLDHLRPGAGGAAMGPALQLADSLIQDSGGHGVVLVLSDGAFGASAPLPQVSVPVEFQPIGSSGDNQGITAVDVRPDQDGSGRWSAFVRVANYANRPVELESVATADGLVLEARRLQLGARGRSDLYFSLPPGTGSFGFALNGGGVLGTDDRVELRLDAVQPRSVLLVSNDSEPIEKVLKGIPGVSLSTISPASYKDGAGADLVVLDGFVPADLPDADLLIMNPPMEAPGFSGSAAPAEATVLRSIEGSPLMESVDLHSLRLAQLVRVETPEWAHAVAEGQSGPLILQGERNGRGVIVFAFDWLLHDLPRMQAFPLLLSNAVAQLTPTSLPRAVRPGESVTLRPMGDATDVTVELPDGGRQQLSLDAGAASFGGTEQVGSYRVTWHGTRQGDLSSGFNVNLADPAESEVTPRSWTVEGGSPTMGFSLPVPGLPLWPMAAVALLIVLSLEWSYFAWRS